MIEATTYETRCAELMLADAVRDLVDRLAPGDGSTIRAGLETAMYLYASGASVAEALEETRQRILSRLRHPSYTPLSLAYAHDGGPVDPVAGQV